MRIIYAMLLTVLTSSLVAAQEADSIWTTDAASSLSFVRSGFRNWQEGGINSFAVTAGFTTTTRRGGQEYDVRLGFGLVQQDTLGLRKAEDIIDLRSAVSFEGGRFFSRFQPTVAARFRSQFAKGFSYSGAIPVHVSSFLAPATLQQSVGLAYGPGSAINVRLGTAAKETIVVLPELRSRYGVDPNRNVRFEAGLEAFAEYSGTLVKNVDVISRLQLFAAVNQEDFPDALLETLITMHVNRWLQVKVEHVVLYDADIRRELQMKEIVSLGFALTLR